MIEAFRFSVTPDICFGTGSFELLPGKIKKFGSRILLVTGSRSLEDSGRLDELMQSLKDQDISFSVTRVESEPTTGMIDAATDSYRDEQIDAVVALGGGSVIDAGKAVSAMLTKTGSVAEYLESVGDKQHDGYKVPLIALPTTSGTGSESTKNAVICRRGPGGYKKSLRHDRFVPDVAIVDPALTLGCPPHITAMSGLDAFSQLLESYTSTASNPLTDSIALEAVRCIHRSLLRAYSDGEDIAARTDMSFASMISLLILSRSSLSAFTDSIRARTSLLCSSLIFLYSRIWSRSLRKTSKSSLAWVLSSRSFALMNSTFSTLVSVASVKI